ncbi:GntR family transcriptional regulator [Nocardioides zeae]|uniref:GntR family transcriptional regulator n=1 Tax=Nocardioides imazamoxiresistens TaxID=3231893 RepID=A0ABU3PUG0_9ACTN|nr:GntR family transcriptional regulator [Nocardioides zeae]MDT9592861.1 GntR family transcriptional regulator [Nocardioides zeae]
MDETEGGAVAEEVRRRLLRTIASGALGPGDRLGTERELAERFGVARATLRSALVPLHRAGVLERRTGRGGGTFVRGGVIEREAAERLGLPERLESGGHPSATVVLGARVRPATPTERALLELEAGTAGTGDPQVAEVERLRFADALPLSVETARFPAALVPGLVDGRLDGSLYDLLADHHGLRPDVAEEQITVVHATPAEAENLEVPVGAPLLHLLRVARTAVGTPFELSDDLFRADRVRLVARRDAADRHEVTLR